MPDLSLFPILCKELDVSINELLSGEKIEENYQNKLEENIIINIVSLKKKIKKMLIIRDFSKIKVTLFN